MPRLISAVLILMPILAPAVGCTHTVTFDDPPRQAYPEKIEASVGYFITPDTLALTSSTRSWFLNTWVVRTGDLLDQYARAFLQDAFEEFRPVSGPRVKEGLDYVITMSIPEFYFVEYRAYLKLHAVVKDGRGRIVHEGGRTRHEGRAEMTAETEFIIRNSTDWAMRQAMSDIVSGLQSTWQEWAK